MLKDNNPVTPVRLEPAASRSQDVAEASHDAGLVMSLTFS